MPKEIIICLPGLGGQKSGFEPYKKLLYEHGVILTEIVNHQRSLEDIKTLCESQEGSVLFLTNCYGAQIALRLLDVLPSGKIKGLIMVEPFFAQFHFWRWPGIIINKIINIFIAAAKKIGIRRSRHNKNIDYDKIARYSIFLQPIFDMRCQSLTDYFGKIEDILRFKLPKKIFELPALMIFSSKGFMRDPGDRKTFTSLFSNITIEEVPAKSHNIITLDKNKIADIIRFWLEKNK